MSSSIFLAPGAAMLGAEESPAQGGSIPQKENVRLPVDFTVVFDGPVDARGVFSKDAVQAHLKDVLKINGKIAAPSGSTVKGHVELIDKNGNLFDPSTQKSKRLPTNLAFRVVFDEIVSPSDQHLKMRAVPYRQSSIINNGREFRSIEIGSDGAVKTAQSLERTEPPQLLPGDELAVKINQKAGGTQAVANPVQVGQKAGVAQAMANPGKVGQKADATQAVVNPVGQKADATQAVVNPVEQKAAAAEGVAQKVADPLKTDQAASAAQAVADPVKIDHNPTDTQAVAEPLSASLRPALRIAAKTNPEETRQLESSSHSSEDASAGKQDDAPKTKEDAPAEKVVPKTVDKVSLIEKLGLSASGPESNKFHVAFATFVSSVKSQPGDPVIAQLVDDLRIGKQVMAKAGSTIFGKVESLRPSCRWGNAVASKESRFQRNAAFKVRFFAVATADGKKFAINGYTPPQLTVFNNGGAVKQIVVSEKGEIVKVENADRVQNSALPAIATTILSSATMGPTGVIAMPLIAVGVLAKAQPTMWRGMQKTFVSKGNELIVVPGDQLQVQARIGDTITGAALQFNQAQEKSADEDSSQ